MCMMKTIKIFLCFVMIGLLTGCGGGGGGGSTDATTIDPNTIEPSSIATFSSVNGDICTEDDKPVIRLFSTRTCPHCQWVAGAFDPVVKMYVEEGLIVAHHWEVDTGDDLLTDQVETNVPDSEIAIYYSFNSQNTVPTFVFGCRYYRVGNGYESQNNLRAEAAEFMAVIEALLDVQ